MGVPQGSILGVSLIKLNASDFSQPVQNEVLLLMIQSYLLFDPKYMKQWPIYKMLLILVFLDMSIMLVNMYTKLNYAGQGKKSIFNQIFGDSFQWYGLLGHSVWWVENTAQHEYTEWTFYIHVNFVMLYAFICILIITGFPFANMD